MERIEAYQIISDMVFKGFLSMHANFAGKLFVFKTVNNKEYDLIKYYSGSLDRPNYESIFNSYYMAFSVFMVGQENVIINRDEYIKKLYQFFISMPAVFCKEILKELELLKVKMYLALEFVEGFSYAFQYRRLWKILGLNFLSGIAGSENLGLNVFQENWIYLNKTLDEEEAYNQQFSFAVLIASASNAKGAKQLRAKHDASLQTMEDKRKKLSREGPIKSTNWTAMGWAAPVDTAEELVAELERQMHGLKVIDDYLHQLEKNAEEHNRKAQEKIEESNKKHEGEKPLSGEQRVLTPKEMSELMSQKSNNLIILPPEDVATPEDKERYLSKVGGKVLTGRK